MLLLEEGDRTLWNRATIAEANRVLAAAVDLGRTGPYQLQAAIAFTRTPPLGPKQIGHGLRSSTIAWSNGPRPQSFA